MSAADRWVRVLDSGKVGGEHFEFNRGVLQALRGAGADVVFHGFRSMVATHAPVLASTAAGAGRASARATSFGGLEDRPTRWGRAAAKLGGLWPTLQALSSGDRLVVAYAAPVSHVLLALASRWRRAPTVVFLHAEVEFLNSGRGARLIGEKLMTLALRWAGTRLQYLMLTDEGVRVLRECGGTRARIGFCPHPMSDRVFSAPADAAAAPRAGAFTMIKSAQDVLSVQGLLRTLPDGAGVDGCTFNGQGRIEAQAGDPAAVLDRKRFLSREELESSLRGTRWFLFPPGPAAYALTASGLACSAAAAGARVLGLDNAFMRCYTARYPQAFSISGGGLQEIGHAARAVDNLADIAGLLLAAGEG